MHNDHRTSDHPTTRPERAPMDRTRRAALYGGVLYLLTFVASIPTLVLKAPVVDHTDFILGAGGVAGVEWGALLDVACALFGIGTAVALYPVIRRHGRSGAIGFVASRTLEAATMVVGAVSLLSIVTLRQDLAGTAGADAATLTTVGAALLAVHDWTFLLGPGVMPAINALFLGSVLYRSRLVPRVLPTMGLIGAPLLLIAAAGVVFGLWDQVSSPSAIATIPIALWELSLGIWLTFKGFTASPAVEGGPSAPTDVTLQAELAAV